MRILFKLISFHGALCLILFIETIREVFIITPNGYTSLSFFLDITNMDFGIGFARWIITDSFSGIPLLVFGLAMHRWNKKWPKALLATGIAFMLPGIIYHLTCMWDGPIMTLINAPILIASLICYVILFFYARGPLSSNQKRAGHLPPKGGKL